MAFIFILCQKAIVWCLISWLSINKILKKRKIVLYSMSVAQFFFDYIKSINLWWKTFGRFLYFLPLIFLSHWYGHLKYKSLGNKLENFGIFGIILISWGIAFFEYCLMVPANRIGSKELGGNFTLTELKVIQEAISLTVFLLFVLVFFK